MAGSVDRDMGEVSTQNIKDGYFFFPFLGKLQDGRRLVADWKWIFAENQLQILNDTKFYLSEIDPQWGNKLRTHTPSYSILRNLAQVLPC